MEIMIFILAFLVILLVVVTLVGHAIWLIAATIIKALRSKSETSHYQTLNLSRCPNCSGTMASEAAVCSVCGVAKPSGITLELLSDLQAARRQIERFHRSGVLDTSLFEALTERLEDERLRLLGGTGPFSSPAMSSSNATQGFEKPRSVVTEPITTSDKCPPLISPLAVVTSIDSISFASEPISPVSSCSVDELIALSDERETSEYPAKPIVPSARKPLTEVVAAFMEESNIRWGEIIGGLLIIGCSTALVVSLWAEISQIPVLKFLIFTTVTTALFGVGLYTEHRWKLPTTSRGILTIATLLVPLNFLAIAAVSAGNLPPDMLVIASELIAPAVFLCLVYFAGRVLTPVWPHLLTAGVLGSSVGQLLVRHFASPEASPVLMVAIGAFPIACYAGGTAWMMRQVATQRALREKESTSIFITLGAITFAAVLPFGLLLYKSGPIGITMMYLAPLVSVAGLPALTLGTVLWRRITSKALLAQQTAGTTLAILGTLTVLLGMILAWPNPASIIPAALLNFAVFSLLAIWLRIPSAHFIASMCLALAYVVFFHVLAGHVSWQNLRVTSLLEVSVSASSGQALALMFLVYLAASEWLRRKKREWESRFYLWSTILVAAISLSLTSVFGMGISGDPLHLSFIFTLYSLGAFWIGTRWKLTGFNWIGSGLLLTALAQAFVQWLNVLFPWQTAFLMHATLCTAAAIVSTRYEGTANGAIAKVLNHSSIISSLVAVLCLLQAREWQTTPTQAERVWWLTSIGFGLLWLNRHRVLFTLFQVALTCGAVLSVKAVLQQYDWYEYLPHAFLHPWSLQIQGTVLVLICLAWTMLRFVTKRVAESFTRSPKERNAWAVDAWRLLDAQLALDRMLSWALLCGLVLLAVYGAWSGIFQELTSAAHETYVWNIAGFPHEEAFGLGSWILMGLLVIAMLLNFRERGRRIYALGAVAGVTTVIPFAAAHWEGQFATASAWRWLAAGFLLLASLPIWFRMKLSEQFNLQTGSAGQERDDLCQLVRGLLLAVTLVPLAVLTAYPALKAVYYMPVHGPSSGIFSLLDARVSYGVPLVLVSLALIGYAWREKLPKYAFVSGLFFNITATMVYLLSVVAVNGSMNRVVLAHTIQLNAIFSALYALVWLSTRNRWITRLEPDRVRKVGSLLGIQIGICAVANALLIIPVAIKLVLRPDLAGIGTFEVGSIRGWIAFLLTVVGAAWLVREPVKSLKAGHLFATLCGASCLIAFTAAGWDAANWSGFHTLIIGTVLTSFVMLLARSLPLWRNETGNIPSWQQKFSLRLVDDWQRDCGLLATAGGLFVVLLSFRARFAEPSTAWWSIAPLLGMTGLFAALHWQTLKRIYLYVAVVQFCSAALFWWKMQFPVLVPGESEGMQAILISLPASSILWLAMELRARKLAPSNKSTAFSLHNAAALGSLLCMAFVVLPGLLFDAAGAPAPQPAWSDWLSMASILALLISCLWDARAKHSIASLYFAGLLTIGLTLDHLDLAPHRLAWAGTVALALFCVVASLVWRCRAQILNLTGRLGIPRRIDSTVTGLKWLIDFNVTGVVVVGMAAFWIDLNFLEWPLRFTASLAVLSQAITFALLVEGAGRGRWQRAAIAISLMGLVFIGWSWLTPTINGTWLNRAVILMVQMFFLTAAYGLFLQKRIKQQSEWVRSFRACVPGVLVAGTVALIFTLCTEVFYQLNFGAVRINQVSLIAVGLTLTTAAVTFVKFTLSPHLDPLELSEIGRMKYVYVAEVMLALLFMHVRLTLPWLFTGFFEDYWPLVIMAIAYLGVIASEVLRRRNLLVLARPIERTGAFLPLLPVLAFWVAQSNVDYSILLFLVGGIYGGLSILRKSFAFGLFAAIAGNGGLWFLLHRTQNYGFLQHPQLWLIPVALSILVAAHLNRERYSEDQITGVRYYSLLMIYASSTADIFLNGVADSPWLPLILAALSLCGVFAGISLRIRGLLLLGSVFLLLAIVTMIYYASVNLGWTWLWYIAGIVTGATIIFMFAVFEKKRGEVLRVVEGLKEWES